MTISSKLLPGTIMVAIATMFMAIFFDFIILRQVVVFVSVSYLLGFLILRLLRIHVESRLTGLLFSVGLSLSSLMFFGLLINDLYPLLGIKPLSIVPLSITIGCILLALLVLCIKHGGFNDGAGKPLNDLKYISLRSMFLFSIPVLSVLGSIYRSSHVLMIMIIAISVLIASCVFSRRIFPDKYYPLITLVVSMSLLFHTSLISKYIMGYDLPLEYYVFRWTEIRGLWQHPVYTGGQSYSAYANIQSMLSTTILPTIYSILMNVDGEFIFKVVYPFIFSLATLVLYKIYRSETESARARSVALISVFFFVSNSSFFGVEPLGLARQMIGTFFFVLLIYLIVERTMSIHDRRVLYLVFGFALVVSHYTLAYVFIFYIFIIYLLNRSKVHGSILDRTMVLYIVVLSLGWNMFISDSPLKGLIDVVGDIYSRSIVDLFNPASRSTALVTLTTQGQSIIGRVHRLLLYTTTFFVATGVLKLVKSKQFRSEYRLLSILSALILFASVVVPNFAPAINLSRFYGISLMLLAPFCTLGGKTIFGVAVRRRNHDAFTRENLELRLVSLLLITTFLFQVGFVNHVTGDSPLSYSLDLSRKEKSDKLDMRISLYNCYIVEQEAVSANWLSKNIGANSTVYSDAGSRNLVLTAYALRSPPPRERTLVLDRTTKPVSDAYVYLRRLNIESDVLTGWEDENPHNMSEISSILNNSNKIYSNGYSEIYSVPMHTGTP